ncbi:MAG: class I SAM-dependent methyltransferase [Nitrospirota bacterium]|nr:class I SAM-dependent methyltransferase [Nitrospirota bacterium]
MNKELQEQKEFWDRELDQFDAIYTARKSPLSAYLDRVFRWDMFARYEYTFTNAAPIPGKTVLDVGCGTGRYSLEFARRGSARVVGLDVSEEMIRACRDRTAQAGLDGQCEFVQTDLLAFRTNEMFDVSIGIGLFDYVKDARPVLQKMKERTKDRTIASFPRTGTWRALVRKVRLALKGCPVYFYSADRIGLLLTEAGYRSYHISKIGQLYCVTAFVEEGNR